MSWQLAVAVSSENPGTSRQVTFRQDLQDLLDLLDWFFEF
jgi:hypothetical protein